MVLGLQSRTDENHESSDFIKTEVLKIQCGCRCFATTFRASLVRELELPVKKMLGLRGGGALSGGQLLQWRRGCSVLGRWFGVI